MVKKKERIEALNALSQAPDFWNDAQNAAGTLKEMEALRSEVQLFEDIEKKTHDLLELIEMFESASDDEQKEVEKQYEEIAKEFGELEFKSLLGGQYDRNDVIMTIHSGAGGVDAQDWAQMLMRMYLRWAERNDFAANIIDESKGTEAGIKSATIEISGLYAYGYLRGEAGVHRLVRLSPFNADNLRQTSFALVEVLPVIGEIAEVAINQEDLKIDTYRSSGAGGQHVNTTDSAVRITHVPSGIVVTCQSERSQLQNRERAMKVLKAKLHQKYLEDQEKERLKLRGERQSAEWGSQIRSYVLHPYKMVKDHRSKFETSNAEQVLDGDLADVIEANLRLAASQNK